VARSIDTLQAHQEDVLKRAHAHRGASFVELFQNCVVYNDGVFDDFAAKAVAADMQLPVVHGQPLLFGPGGRRALRLVPGKLELEVVTIGDGGITAADVLVHDETNRALANLLVALAPPRFPMAIGVLYCDPAPSYEREVHQQAAAAGPAGSLTDLLQKGSTWTV
jgi:2-oxoglutarate ferredoxin oxidoreductase subunit beta